MPTTRLLTDANWLDKTITEADFAVTPVVNTLLVTAEQQNTTVVATTTSSTTSVWYNVMIAASVFAIAGFILSRKQQQ